jgi:alpha-glucosidase
MILGLGLSGVAFTGADIPGFAANANGELLARWYQLGAFYPLMRNHSAKGTTMQEPWRFGEPYLSLARAALEMRYALLPTMYTLMYNASQNGQPVMRPLVMLSPADPDCLNANHQFMFGDALLVSPVVTPSTSKKLTYLPKGRWLEFTNLIAGAVLESGYTISDAPLEQIPLYLRAGTALAVTQPAKHTTTANWTSLTWHVLPAQSIHGELFEDAGDGDGASRHSFLRGELENNVLVLEKHSTGSLELERTTETIVLYQINSLQSVVGAKNHSLDNGVLRLEMPATWTRLEICF